MTIKNNSNCDKIIYGLTLLVETNTGWKKEQKGLTEKALNNLNQGLKEKLLRNNKRKLEFMIIYIHNLI